MTRVHGFSSVRLDMWVSTGLAVSAIVAASVASQSVSCARATLDHINIDAVPLPLNPQDLLQTAIGDFVYSGGLALTSRQTDRLHGLSDLEVTGTDKLVAVGDLGIFLEARLVLDRAERLIGVTDVRLTPLTGEDGQPLSDKGDFDAEGLALMPNGDRLVSFERRHRIWLYPASGGRPRPVPAPAVDFPPNAGMEALAADPEAGPDAYVVGAEVSGDTWTCRLSWIQCIKGPTVDKPREFRLVALKRLPEKRTAYLLGAFDAVRGNRIFAQDRSRSGSRRPPGSGASTARG